MGKTFRKPKQKKPAKVRRVGSIEQALVAKSVQVGGAGAHKDNRTHIKHKRKWEIDN